MSEPVTTFEYVGDGVGVVRLDRPAARNAMNTQMLEELLSHLDAVASNDEIRALVISSTDQMGLSAGADVKEDLDKAGHIKRMQLFADVYDVITGYEKPTVAACHGVVVGGGAEVAVACDLRVAGSNMRMRFPGASLGVPVGPARLVSQCGLSVAKYLLLTSRDVMVDDAHRWGLVHQVAPAGRTEEAAIQLAAGVAANPPESVARIKRMLHEWDGIVERTAAEGRGQVEWQSESPGLGSYGGSTPA